VNEAARGAHGRRSSSGGWPSSSALDPDIKAFAQRMVDDHTRANDELKQLAERKKWKLPTQTTSTQEMTYNRLHDKAGADFDREYAKAMVKHHDHDVKMFETYAESGKDADLKSFAASTIATLRDHQQMARANASKLGVDCGRPTKPTARRPWPRSRRRVAKTPRRGVEGSHERPRIAPLRPAEKGAR
jgi:putative membrane protein